MMIECLTRRIGATTVDIGKIRYRFQPPDPLSVKKGEWTTSIAEITAEEHIKYFLSRKNFREYDPEVTAKENAEFSKASTVFNGFSITKYKYGGTEGYIVIDMRDKANPHYAGLDGIWVDKSEGIMPFVHEIDAWEWLKMEAPELAKIKEEEEKASKPAKSRALPNPA